MVEQRTHLVGLVGGPGPGPRRGARLSPFPATLYRCLGILPHQVSPYARNILKPVTCSGAGGGQGQRSLSLTPTPRPTSSRLARPGTHSS